MVCSNDLTAIGVLHALDDTKYKVPEDVSVVGFDDIHLAQFMLPPLTTVQMSCKDLAAAAIQALRAGTEPGHPLAAQREWPITDKARCTPVHGFPEGYTAGAGEGGGQKSYGRREIACGRSLTAPSRAPPRSSYSIGSLPVFSTL